MGELYILRNGRNGRVAKNTSIKKVETAFKNECSDHKSVDLALNSD